MSVVPGSPPDSIDGKVEKEFSFCIISLFTAQKGVLYDMFDAPNQTQVYDIPGPVYNNC